MLSKFPRKTLIYTGLFIWIIFINIWIYNYKYSSFRVDNTSIYDEEYQSNPDNEKVSLVSENHIKQVDVMHDKDIKSIIKSLTILDQRTIDSHSSIYDDILANHNLKDILTNLNFKQRCDLYFKNLFLDDNNWYLNPDEDLPLDHRGEFDYDPFRKKVYSDIKLKYMEEHKLKPQQVDEAIIQELIKQEYDNFWENTLKVEQKITDYLSHLRIFNKCYITNDNTYQINQNNQLLAQETNLRQSDESSRFKYTANENLVNTKSFTTCNEIESRIYKWLSFAYPIYERFTGEKLAAPPDLTKYIKYPEVFKPSNLEFESRTGKPIKSDFTGNEPCFLNRFKNALNGKGIVLSISDGHVDDTVKLIHLLRALNNHYPIQIVYFDEINDDSKTKLVNAARNKMIDLPQSFQKVTQYFPEDYIHNEDGGLPKQEIWFVNVYHAIHHNYRKKFGGFSNKFLATVFNSFEEFMLLDADSVLVQNPEYFFNLAGYIKRGAYFFKDRTAAEFRPQSDGKFFQKITPSVLDKLMFDIPIITSKTLGREFFEGMKHYMESGLVLINRSVHFNSVMTMVQMNLFKPVTDRVYGDKEIFWLGFIANGDEEFHFNKYFAAAIGTETPDDERVSTPGDAPPKGREVCSAHPGHINGEDEQSLLWFNSGYQFCSKNVNFKEEVAKQERLKSIKDANTLKQYYENPIPLRHAVIPPFKNKWEMTCKNTVGEPDHGWRKDKGYCRSYLWCAYSSIGGTTKDGGDNTQEGQIFEFDQKSVDLFQYYGDIWVGNE